MKNIKAVRAYAMVITLVAIWFIFNHYTEGAFLQARNLSNLFRQTSVTGILAAGMVMVIVSSQIDLSIGSVVAFLGGLLALLSPQVGPTEAFLVTILAGATIGIFQGYVTSYHGVPSFIMTLGGMMAFRGAAMWITSNSTIPLEDNWIQKFGTAHVENSISLILTVVVLSLISAVYISDWWKNRKMNAVSSALKLSVQVCLLWSISFSVLYIFSQYDGVPVPVLLMLAIMSLTHFMAVRTVWGRHVFAIGGNMEAAFLSGIPVRLRMLSVFALMGVLSAIASVVLTARVGSASPDAGQLLELDAIASCVIGGTSLMGGRGTVFGALLGALLIESLNNGMSLANMEPFWQFIIKGIVLVTAVWVDVASKEKAS